jgi:protein-S-isoprenylcysteine O-methyltransferase Ste14
MSVAQVLENLETWAWRIAIVLGIVVIVLPVLGFRRASARPRGRVSGRAMSLLRWPAVAALAVLYVAGGVLLWRPVPLVLPPWGRAILLGVGFPLYLAGVGLYLWGYRTLGRWYGVSSSFGAALYQDHRLVEAGPYALVRHPMYLGVMLAAVGALLLFRTWAMLLYAPSAFSVIRRARQEEHLLAKELGPTWEAYAQRVPAWIPRSRRG